MTKSGRTNKISWCWCWCWTREQRQEPVGRSRNIVLIFQKKRCFLFFPLPFWNSLKRIMDLGRQYVDAVFSWFESNEWIVYALRYRIRVIRWKLKLNGWPSRFGNKDIFFIRFFVLFKSIFHSWNTRRLADSERDAIDAQNVVAVVVIRSVCKHLLLYNWDNASQSPDHVRA